MNREVLVRARRKLMGLILAHARVIPIFDPIAKGFGKRATVTNLPLLVGRVPGIGENPSEGE